MKLQDLKPNPKNPRKISKEKLEMLKKSLDEFGDLSGIIFNEQLGYLTGGHQRGKVLPPDAEVVIEQSYNPPSRTGTTAEGYVLIDGERFKYRQVSWDKVKDDAANLAANKHGGEFDLPLLREILLDLDAHNVDMELTGFDKVELEKIIAPAQLLPSKGDADDVPDLPMEPRVKSGELWRLGQHVLYCGDSTLEESFKKLMGDEKADMVWTDPPYNVAYEGSNGMKIQNDDMNDESFYKFLYDAFTNLFMYTKEGGGIYIAHADSEGFNFRKAMKESGWLMKQCLIWVKQSLVMGRQDYQWRHEPILYGWKPGDSHSWYSDRSQTTILEFDKPKKNDIHPTMKPVELIAYMVRNSSANRDIVLDCFGGSGSTLIACEQAGRRARLIELDPRYASAILTRWENFTGNQGELIHSPE